MGNTICCSDFTCHSAAMNGRALLGSALPMVELTMSIMVVSAIRFFFNPDQLYGFSGSLSSYAMISSSPFSPSSSS